MFLIIIATTWVLSVINWTKYSALQKQNIECQTQVINLQYTLNENNIVQQVLNTLDYSRVKDVELVSNKEKIHLKKIISKPKLIFWFDPDGSCMDCVEHTLTILNQLVDSIGVENIILITKYERLNELYLLSNKNKIRFNCFNFLPELIPVIEHSPLLQRQLNFILQEDLHIRFPFLVHSTDQITNTYYKKIIDYFNSLKNHS